MAGDLTIDGAAGASLTNIERIAFAQVGSQTLTLDRSGVAAVTGAAGALFVDGASDDTVIMQDGGWIVDVNGPQWIGTASYDLYRKDGATVYVQSGMSVVNDTGTDPGTGTAGDDVLVYEPGSGPATFVGGGGNDTLRLGAALDPSQIRFGQTGTDLNITFATGMDSLSLTDHFGTRANRRLFGTAVPSMAEEA
jgi:hypothetical protein